MFDHRSRHQERNARSNYYVIFGAGVGPEGQPSCSMRWRVKDAVQSAADDPDARFVAAGGASGARPAEAQVMKELLLSHGVAPARIIVEDRSRDTLESVVNCRRILADRGDTGRVYVCTSYYHVPRCRLLFAILGVYARPGPVNTERAVLKPSKWNYLILRELAAAPWDSLLALRALLLGWARRDSKGRPA